MRWSGPPFGPGHLLNYHCNRLWQTWCAFPFQPEQSDSSESSWEDSILLACHNRHAHQRRVFLASWVEKQQHSLTAVDREAQEVWLTDILRYAFQIILQNLMLFRLSELYPSLSMLLSGVRMPSLSLRLYKMGKYQKEPQFFNIPSPSLEFPGYFIFLTTGSWETDLGGGV
jgi:hypothetical protein